MARDFLDTSDADMDLDKIREQIFTNANSKKSDCPPNSDTYWYHGWYFKGRNDAWKFKIMI